MASSKLSPYDVTVKTLPPLETTFPFSNFVPAWKTMESSTSESPAISFPFSKSSGYPPETTIIVVALLSSISREISSNFSLATAKNNSTKSVFNLGTTTSVSGSPILTLYSITIGSFLTFINPIKTNPLYGIPSFWKPSIVGFTIRVSIFSIKTAST
ncbi:hypothetical protein D3C80_1387540 [compost metagenome]